MKDKYNSIDNHYQ